VCFTVYFAAIQKKLRKSFGFNEIKTKFAIEIKTESKTKVQIFIE